MVATMLKRSVVCAMLMACLLAAPGCGVKQSDYDAKVAEAKAQADKVSQLQKDLDAVKSSIENARQARKKDAEARTKALDQENVSLKERVKTLEQENASLKTGGDSAVAAARDQIAKAEQARNAAEAKAKALEQENADLKKKSAKPLDFLRKKT